MVITRCALSEVPRRADGKVQGQPTKFGVHLSRLLPRKCSRDLLHVTAHISLLSIRSYLENLLSDFFCNVSAVGVFPQLLELS